MKDYSKTGASNETSGPRLTYLDTSKETGMFEVRRDNGTQTFAHISGYVEGAYLSFTDGNPEKKTKSAWSLNLKISAMDTEFGVPNEEGIPITVYNFRISQLSHSNLFGLLNTALGNKEWLNSDPKWIKITPKKREGKNGVFFFFNYTDAFGVKNPTRFEKKQDGGFHGVPDREFVTIIQGESVYDWTSVENFTLDLAKELVQAISPGEPIMPIPPVDKNGYAAAGVTRAKLMEELTAARNEMTQASAPKPTQPAMPATSPESSAETFLTKTKKAVLSAKPENIESVICGIITNKTVISVAGYNETANAIRAGFATWSLANTGYTLSLTPEGAQVRYTANDGFDSSSWENLTPPGDDDLPF